MSGGSTTTLTPARDKKCRWWFLSYFSTLFSPPRVSFVLVLFVSSQLIHVCRFSYVYFHRIWCVTWLWSTLNWCGAPLSWVHLISLLHPSCLSSTPAFFSGSPHLSLFLFLLSSFTLTLLVSRCFFFLAIPTLASLFSHKFLVFVCFLMQPFEKCSHCPVVRLYTQSSIAFWIELAYVVVLVCFFSRSADKDRLNHMHDILKRDLSYLVPILCLFFMMLLFFFSVFRLFRVLSACLSLLLFFS